VRCCAKSCDIVVCDLLPCFDLILDVQREVRVLTAIHVFALGLGWRRVKEEGRGRG
jgi:hypothetical protein